MSERTAWFYREQLEKMKPPTWATIIPTRSTKKIVAIHNTVGHAKAAVSSSSPPRTCTLGYDAAKGGYPVAEAEIHELVDGEWVLRWEIPEGTYPNELPWK